MPEPFSFTRTLWLPKSSESPPNGALQTAVLRRFATAAMPVLHRPLSPCPPRVDT